VLCISQVTIQVEVNGLKNNKGHVMIGLYNLKRPLKEENFKGNTAIINKIKATATFIHTQLEQCLVFFFYDEKQ
jgi:uncharacterized protein (DUF2141 family)